MNSPHAYLDSLHTDLKGCVPILELPEHAYGRTGYIDGLEATDMPNSVMVGSDRHGRAFIAVKYWTSTDVENDTDVDRVVEVMFPKDGLWTSGAKGGYTFLSSSRTTEEDRGCIMDLIESGFASKWVPTSRDGSTGYHRRFTLDAVPAKTVPVSVEDQIERIEKIYGSVIADIEAELEELRYCYDSYDRKESLRNRLIELRDQKREKLLALA